MLLVGIDWADREHVYCLMDEAAPRCRAGTMEHTAEGLEQLHGRCPRTRPRARRGPGGDSKPRTARSSVRCSIRGSPSTRLIPKRWSAIANGSGSLAPNRIMRDAWVLATLLRTDRQLYRPIMPDSEVAQELRTLTRDRADLVKTQTMLSNQLTACVKAYFPEFLTFFADPDRPVALAVLQAFPTREQLACGFAKRSSKPSCAAITVRIAVIARGRFTKGCRRRGFRSRRQSCARRPAWPAPWWCSFRRWRPNSRRTIGRFSGS